MKRKLPILDREDVFKVKASILAEKYDCSITYVRMVLKGYRPIGSLKAQLILKDSHDIVKIYKRDTNQVVEYKK